MEKSPEAFRTISEVADLLDTPAHVLRFWESRFPQIRPVKRAGGRRYYRPGDVALLSGIKRLLHDDGMTIRGVQKILREHGVRHVAGLSAGEGAASVQDDIEAALAAEFGPEPEEDETPLPPSAGQTAQIISLERAIARSEPPAQTLGSFEEDGADSRADAPSTDVEPVAEAPFVYVDDSDSQEVLTFETEDRVPDAPVILPSTEGGAHADDDLDAVGEDGLQTTLAAELRKLPSGALAHRRDELIALRNRMMDLRDRLAAASRRRVR